MISCNHKESNIHHHNNCNKFIDSIHTIYFSTSIVPWSPKSAGPVESWDLPFFLNLPKMNRWADQEIRLKFATDLTLDGTCSWRYVSSDYRRDSRKILYLKGGPFKCQGWQFSNVGMFLFPFFFIAQGAGASDVNIFQMDYCQRSVLTVLTRLPRRAELNGIQSTSNVTNVTRHYGEVECLVIVTQRCLYRSVRSRTIDGWKNLKGWNSCRWDDLFTYVQRNVMMVSLHRYILGTSLDDCFLQFLIEAPLVKSSTRTLHICFSWKNSNWISNGNG